MTQLSRTVMIPQLASTSLRKSAYGTTVCGALYKHAQRVQFVSPRRRGEVGSRAAQLSGEGKDSAAIYGCSPVARCSSPQPSPASGARKYIEALISQ
jgi:hypothetical protein